MKKVFISSNNSFPCDMTRPTSRGSPAKSTAAIQRKRPDLRSTTNHKKTKKKKKKKKKKRRRKRAPSRHRSSPPIKARALLQPYRKPISFTAFDGEERVPWLFLVTTENNSHQRSFSAHSRLRGGANSIEMPSPIVPSHEKRRTWVLFWKNKTKRKKKKKEKKKR
jgi:hypothetical protein